MRDLSITQEYLICAVNEKGKISGFSTERLVCLVAAGLLDMELAGAVRLTDKRVEIAGEQRVSEVPVSVCQKA